MGNCCITEEAQPRGVGCGGGMGGRIRREDICILMADSQCGIKDINGHKEVNRRPV